MTDRREFICALAAGGVCAALPACAALPVRDPAVEEAIRREIASGRVSCVCCGAPGAAVYAVGNRRPGLGEPQEVDADALFELASVSKVFTAHIAALLRHEGAIDIDVPFTTYLPDHVLAREGTAITVRDLAAHVSGFTNGWMGKTGVYGGRAWPFADDAAYVRTALSVRPVCVRRTRCLYCCHNFILLGLILERVTGLDLDALARKYVWGPLAMSSTTWKNVPGDPRAVRIWTGGWRPLGTKGDESARGVTRPLGHAGVFSSLNDLLLYADDLAQRRAFPRDCYDLLLSPEHEGASARRSFGWNMSADANPPGWSPQAVSHSGYTGSYVAVDPKTRRAAVVLTNLSVGDPKARSASHATRRSLAAAAARSVK